MMVDKSMLDWVFGYREVNVGDSMLKSKAEQSLATQGIAKLLDYVFAQGSSPDDRRAARIKGANFMKKYQRIVEEGVQEIKDIVVLRTGTVLLGNESSNISMLFLRGLSLPKILAKKAEALEALNVFRTQMARVHELQVLIATNTNPAEHTNYIKEISKLTESMKNNPVKPLIDKGFMPAIVDDVETETQDYSYKAEFFDYLEDKFNKRGKVGQLAANVSKFMYVSPSGDVHKFMKYATQVSDFTARYALYYHLKEKGGQSEQEILRIVSESFVLYDVPAHRNIEFMNRIGLLMFTKFIVRIQKPLAEAVRAAPLKAATLWLFNSWMDMFEVITESSFTNRLYNPLRAGPLGYPGVIDETLFMNAALHTTGFKQ
jgi:hypothetical protein